MKFSTRLTYALCMMIEIYRRSEMDDLVSLACMSKNTGISKNYLEQLALLLRNHSLLASISGRKGGYRLAKPTGEIKIIDIVNASIGPVRLTQCVAFPDSCMKSESCTCRRYLVLINANINALLEDYSLEEIGNDQMSAQIMNKIDILQERGKAKVQDFFLDSKMEEQAITPLPCRKDFQKSNFLELLKRLVKSKNSEPVTYHDPCILSRYYGLTEEPRFLLSKATTNFVEMIPNRSENWCCRGGGGANRAYNTRRAELSRIKLDQLLKTGARIVATSCPNCIDGLNDLFREHNLDLKAKLVSELVATALVNE